MEVKDGSSVFCDFEPGGGVADWEISSSDLVDDSWANVTSMNFDTIEACDAADIKFFSINVRTDPPSAGFPYYFFLDQLASSSVFCVPPVSGDWIILNGDDCTLNEVDVITGNLNITNGGLQIQGSGSLEVQGGFVYISSGSNLTILSGGNLTG